MNKNVWLDKQVVEDVAVCAAVKNWSFSKFVNEACKFFVKAEMCSEVSKQ